MPARIHHSIYCVIIILFMVSCKQKHFDESIENMNKGEITLYADEAYQQIIDELVKSYENVYPEAKINVTYASEQEVMNNMFSGAARMMISGKKLSAEEIAAIESANKMRPQVSAIASEAIAVITSISNTDTTFDYDEFAKSRKQGYTGDFDNKKFVFLSRRMSLINQVIGEGSADASLSNMFSLDNTDTLINYVKQTNDSYGFISFAEISDTDDPATAELLRHIRVLPISKTDSLNNKKVYELSQSTLAIGDYPLKRSIYIVKGNMAQSLGTGFVNFMYRSKASRIFLKAGLIPAVMPEREFMIKE